MTNRILFATNLMLLVFLMLTNSTKVKASEQLFCAPIPAPQAVRPVEKPHGFDLYPNRSKLA